MFVVMCYNNVKFVGLVGRLGCIHMVGPSQSQVDMWRGSPLGVRCIVFVIGMQFDNFPSNGIGIDVGVGIVLGTEFGVGVVVVVELVIGCRFVDGAQLNSTSQTQTNQAW